MILESFIQFMPEVEICTFFLTVHTEFRHFPLFRAYGSNGKPHNNFLAVYLRECFQILKCHDIALVSACLECPANKTNSHLGGPKNPCKELIVEDFEKDW